MQYLHYTTMMGFISIMYLLGGKHWWNGNSLLQDYSN